MAATVKQTVSVVLQLSIRWYNLNRATAFVTRVQSEECIVLVLPGVVLKDVTTICAWLAMMSY